MSRSVRLYIIATLIALIISFIIFRIVAPPPPNHIVFAAGAEGGAYAQTAETYRAAFEAEGVELEIINTSGSGDNLELLRSGGADAAIVQGGVSSDEDKAELMSLGTIFYEPLWVFFRDGTGILNVDELDLRGFDNLRIAAGTETSGTRLLANRLLDENGVEATILPVSGAEGAAALQNGDVDVLMAVSGPTAPYISDLLSDPAISVLSFPRALAYERRTPFLKRVIFPEGGLDLEGNIPSAPIELIAPVAEVAVGHDLHPAIQALLIEVMVETHRGGTLLSEPGAFPGPDRADLPLAEEAERYYEQGPSFLRSVFPFAVANFLERAWVLAIPLLTLVFPLVKAAPPLYRWRTRRKIYVWYKDLRELEGRGWATDDTSERAEVIEALQALQAEVGQVEVPESYTDELYRLRSHILFVSQLMQKLNDGATTAPIPHGTDSIQFASS